MEDRWNHNIHYHPVILRALPDDCEHVLDVGCGEGLLARELSGRAGHVTAIDLDAPTLELARRHAAADNIDYVEGDFLTHGFEKESFDAAVAVTALHHMGLAEALTRMTELVRPGGRVAVVGVARQGSPVDLGFALAGAVSTRLHKLSKTYWETAAPKVWPPDRHVRGGAPDRAADPPRRHLSPPRPLPLLPGLGEARKPLNSATEGAAGCDLGVMDTAPFPPQRPARVSPHVDGARTHTRRWAIAMGMVGGDCLWDEAAFDAMDFALFAASAHPDAPAPVLDVLSDWYTWLFYFDDVLNEVLAREGLAGVKRMVARAVGRAAPEGPAERALADVGERTMPLASGDWLERFDRSLCSTLEEMRWAMANIDRDRAANPIEYIDTRRLFGGMHWAADLAELGCSTELSPALVALRPVWQLRDCFGDAVCLRNDIVSLRKEVEEGEALSNGVVLIQAFLGCDLSPQQRQHSRRTPSRRSPHGRDRRAWAQRPYGWVSCSRGCSRRGVGGFRRGLG